MGRFLARTKLAASIIFAGALLLTQTAYAACGFTQNNDYVCDGSSSAPPNPPYGSTSGQTQQQRPNLQQLNTFETNSSAAIDYQANLRKIQAIQEQMIADQEKLDNLSETYEHPASGLSCEDLTANAADYQGQLDDIRTNLIAAGAAP